MRTNESPEDRAARHAAAKAEGDAIRAAWRARHPVHDPRAHACACTLCRLDRWLLEERLQARVGLTLVDHVAQARAQGRNDALNRRPARASFLAVRRRDERGYAPAPAALRRAYVAAYDAAWFATYPGELAP